MVPPKAGGYFIEQFTYYVLHLSVENKRLDLSCRCNEKSQKLNVCKNASFKVYKFNV